MATERTEASPWPCRTDPLTPHSLLFSNSQGCGCDKGILSLIAAANADADTLSGAVRLAQTSQCAAALPAGWVNPCPGVESCLGVAKLAVAPAKAVAGK